MTTSKFDFGIRFSDNDFNSTIVPLIDMIYDAMVYRDEPFTVEEIVSIYNESVYGFFIAFQNRKGDNIHKQSTKDYLKITEKNVYLGDRLYEFLEKTMWDNSEFHYRLSGQFGIL